MMQHPAGARDYLDELQRRFAKSWGAVLAGDPAAFSHALRLQGYYTAPEASYTKTLLALFRELAAVVASPFDLHTAQGLQRALNAPGRARCLRRICLTG